MCMLRQVLAEVRIKQGEWSRADCEMLKAQAAGKAPRSSRRPVVIAHIDTPCERQTLNARASRFQLEEQSCKVNS
jgi:hypothetical protein